jgi:hypothetical protein
MIGLPAGTVLMLLLMILFPITAYMLFRIDKRRGDGSVTVLGKG